MLIKAKTLQLETVQRVQFIDLTDDITWFLGETAVRNGIGTISTLHTTTGVFCTEAQDALWHDIDVFLRRLVAERCGYKHNDPRFSDCERHNAAAHLRAILLGSSMTLQVEDGRLILGQFQRIVFAELDGPRSRSVRIQFLGEGVLKQMGDLSGWSKGVTTPLHGGL